MCDFGLTLALASTVIGGVGAIQQGQAAASAAKYQAQVSEMNAKINEKRAQDAIERGTDAEQMKRREVARIQGEQTAAMAANGVDLSFGSPLDTLVDTKIAGELDALTIRTSAEREAYDYRVGASNDRAQAGMSRMEAKNAQTAGYLGAASTILTGGSKAYGQYKSSRIGAIA